MLFTPAAIAVDEPAPGKKHRSEPSFAEGLNFYKLFWVFFIGCFVGVAIEMLWWFVTEGRIESRASLVYGPFNVVYGFGAVLITAALKRVLKYGDWWVFAASMMIGGGFEFVCSFWQEQSLGTVSWEYSDTPFNLQGRTNLMFMIFWGALGLMWIRDLLPVIERFIEKIPNKIGKTLTWALVLFMTFNMVVSTMACRRQSDRRAGIPAENVIDQLLDRQFPDERLMKIYPNMKPVEGAASSPVLD